MTLRKELTEIGFDFVNGVIIWHQTNELNEYGGYPGWEIAEPGGVIPLRPHHEILDHEYDTGYGGPKCPRFIAYDAGFIYFPVQYDGSTWIERVAKDWRQYIPDSEGNMLQTPYPGA